MLYSNYNDVNGDMTKTLLSMPSHKRNEIVEAKSRLEEFAKFKEQHKHLGRRER